MTNKQMFDTANASNDSRIKAIVRESFIAWCKKNGKTPAYPITVQEWWAEEWEESNVL